MEGAVILAYFIIGILFGVFIIPVLDSVVSAILTGIELIKGKWTVQITEYNYQIQKMGNEKSSSAQVIGFAIPTEEEDEDENY